MQPLCQICCNPKRRLRFHTEQLAICQWCVTELSKSETSPAKLIEERRSSATIRYIQLANKKLARLRGLRTPPPELPATALGAVNSFAESAVRRDEGLFQSIYRSMFDDTRRREAITNVAARRSNEVLSLHRQVVADHFLKQQETDAEIREIESDMVRIPETVEQEIAKIFEEAKTTNATKSKEIKLLRAAFAGLIDFDRTEHARLDSSEYEEQKKRIRARDSYRCIRCLRGFDQGELHVHHVLPLSCFGTNSDANLVTLCHPCHNKQHPDFNVTRSFPIKRRPVASRFVAVDVETTGLSNEDSIIEIAAAKFADGRVEEIFCSLVRSNKVIPPAVTRLTGITPSMVKGAPHPREVIREFVAFISNHRLVFHNASFDMRFIGKYLEYFGYPKPSRIIDTLPIARRKLPQLSSHRMAHLIEHLRLPVSRSHRAQDDSLATGLLYLALRDIPTSRNKTKRRKSHP